MNKNLTEAPLWTLLVIDDPKFVPGRSLFELIQLLSTMVEFRYAILDDIDVAGYGQRVGGATEIPLGKPNQELKKYEIIDEAKNLNIEVQQQKIGSIISFLLDHEDSVMKVSDLLKIINDVAQFNWCDFFLFKEYPKNWNNIKGVSYPDIITQSDTTIRAVDSQYIYIYTHYQELVSLVSQHYSLESITCGLLENLEFPY